VVVPPSSSFPAHRGSPSADFSDPEVVSPSSPYSSSRHFLGGPGPSTTSFPSYSTSSFSSLTPDTASYNAELERLKLAYGRSELLLQTERAYSQSQAELHERELNQYRAQLEELRQRYSSKRDDGKGKKPRK
jgi:hypothetical protein